MARKGRSDFESLIASRSAFLGFVGASEAQHVLLLIFFVIADRPAPPAWAEEFDADKSEMCSPLFHIRRTLF